MFLGAMVLGLVGLVAMSLLGFTHGHAAHGHSAHGHAHYSHSSHGHAQHDSSVTKFLALRAIRDKNRELEQTRASNAALVAQAEALKQDALASQRSAELRATQTAQAEADAERMRISARASADAEAIKISTIAEANANAIQKVNQAIADGGELYLRYRQVEMLPLLVPMIADALAQAKLITVSGSEGGQTAAQIQGVIQTVLAAQLITKSGVLEDVKST